MSAMSDYLENEILDHILGTGAYSAPSTVYIGLSTGSFGDDNSGTELSGSGYEDSLRLLMQLLGEQQTTLLLLSFLLLLVAGVQ
ncbi:MAG: hypothetical protein CM15mV111_180 [uncultured marine virus]|nr:MAG: hypothetical protein CM15mV111_180 [uncultured marine virus]